MSLPIIPVEQRHQDNRGVKAVLLGPSGVGKTSQLWTLPPNQTLFMDLEAGDLAVQEWTGDVLRPRTWPEFRMLVAFIGGPNPALENDQVYSTAHFDAACQQYGDPKTLDKYAVYFIDSITALPDSVSNGASLAQKRAVRKPGNRICGELTDFMPER